MEEAYSERYTKVLRRSTIVKVEEIKKIIYNLFGEIKYKHMTSLLSKCAHYHYYKTLSI